MTVGVGGAFGGDGEVDGHKDRKTDLVAALAAGLSGKGLMVSAIIPVKADAEDVVWVASYRKGTGMKFVSGGTATRYTPTGEGPTRDEPIDEPPHGRTEPASQEPGDEDSEPAADD